MSVFGIGNIASNRRAGRREQADVTVHPRTVGLSTPPVPARIHFVKKRGYWILVVRGSPSNINELSAWMGEFKPVKVEQGSTDIQAHFPRLRPEWASLVEHADLLRIDATPGGKLRILMRADPGHLEELLRAEREGRPFILDQHAPIERPRLTPRQRYVLHSCVEWGYYEVPRRITLEGVARRLGIGVNTISVVLRNAESAIMRNFAAFDQKPEASERRRQASEADDE